MDDTPGQSSKNSSKDYSCEQQGGTVLARGVSGQAPWLQSQLQFALVRLWASCLTSLCPHLRIPDRGLVISWVSGGHFRLEIPQKTSGHCTRIGCHCPSHVLEHSREALPFPCSKIGQIQFISCARDTLTHQHLQFTRQVALRPLELYKHPRRWGTLSALRPFYRSGISG